MHDVNHEDGNITEGRSSGSKIREGLVTRSINHQQARHFELEATVCIDDLGFLLNCVHGEVRGSDLLGDTSGFAFLNVGLSDLV
jgi:hypothetical protein